MLKTRGKLLATIDRLLDENKQMRLDGEGTQAIIDSLTQAQDKVCADLKKALEENKELHERVKELKKSLAETGRKVRDQSGADLLFLSLKAIIRVLGKHDTVKDVVRKEMSEIEKMHRQYDAAAQQARQLEIPGARIGSSVPQDAGRVLSLFESAFGKGIF